MRHTKPIAITVAMAAVMIFASISSSNASQHLVEHGVKVKHKHAVLKHKAKVNHNLNTSQTLAKPKPEGEHGAITPPDAGMPKMTPEQYTMMRKSDEAIAHHADGTLSGTSPLDTVVCIGPFNQGGQISGVMVSSANNSVFFAASRYGGLWKSTNAGASWQPSGDTTNENATAITQNPFNPNYIYYSSSLNGTSMVYKSTDGGNTFSAPLTGATGGTSIACDSANANTVYSGTDGTGLQRSTDNGGTWSTVSGTSGVIWSILPLPSSSTYPSGKVLIAEQDGGIYASSDGGSTFSPVTSMAFPTTINDILLANSTSDPKTIYAMFEGPGNGEGGGTTGITAFCKSTDWGVSWTDEDITTLEYNPPPGSAGAGFNQWPYPAMLGVSKANPSIVFCGIQSRYLSTNGGSSWNPLTGSADFHCFATFSGSSGNVLIGCDQGVLLQGDYPYYSATTINTNLVTTLMNGGGFASYGKRSLCGGQDIPNIRLNPPNSALALWSGGDAGYSYISQQDVNTGYIGLWSNNMDRVTNLFGTPSTTSINPPIGSEGANLYNFFIMNNADGQQLYVRSGEGIYRTTNGGTSWDTRLNTTDIPGINFIGCTNPTPGTNPSIFFDGNDGTNHHFYRIDNAKTFSPGTPVDLSGYLPNTTWTMQNITVPSNNQHELYVSFINYNGGGTLAYKVYNANATLQGGFVPHWVSIVGTPGSGGLPAYISVYQIQADPTDTTSLLAATSNGLYFSHDMGVNWYKEPRIPNVSIRQMQLRPSDRKLFLFTYGRGVWYCSLFPPNPFGVQQASVAPTSTAPQLQFSLYPNPATEKLTINPQQALSSSARIAIYSSDGKMISELGWNPTGSEGQEVNISSLPSGVYFLQITDGNTIAKKKFVKM